jgi:hypothetical protein
VRSGLRALKRGNSSINSVALFGAGPESSASTATWKPSGGRRPGAAVKLTACGHPRSSQAPDRRHMGSPERTKAHAWPGVPGGMPVVEVGTVITVLTVDSALQHVCATLREQADRGDITPAERDLLIDGAILLAVRVDDMATDGFVGSRSGWSERALPGPGGRHERHAIAAAA